MLNRTQERFIKNWNRIAEKLSKTPGFQKLPKLDGSILNGGACAGFSFTLAEYVRNNNIERFYQLYNLVCDSDPDILAQGLKLIEERRRLINRQHALHKLNKTSTSDSEYLNNQSKIAAIGEKLENLQANLSSQDCKDLLDFVYKTYIFQEKQNEVQHILSPEELEKESENDKNKREWFQFNGNAGNHERLGNPFINRYEHADQITPERNTLSELKYGIQKIKNNESLHIGIHGNSWGHSILIYRSANVYYIFDSNIGKNVLADTIEDAAKEIIFAANNSITQGTGKLTLLDQMFHFSKVLTLVISFIFFPIFFSLLIYDVFFAKPETHETLHTKLLTNNVCLSWGIISQPEPPLPLSTQKHKDIDCQDFMAQTITKADLIAIFNLYKEYKKERVARPYFNFKWFNNNEVESDDSPANLMNKAATDHERFNAATNYLATNPNTIFAKALRVSIPALTHESTSAITLAP